MDQKIKEETKAWIMQIVCNETQVSVSKLCDHGEAMDIGRRDTRKLVTELIREGYLYKVEDTDQFGRPLDDVIINPEQPYFAENGKREIQA